MISLFFLALGVVRIRRERTLKIGMLYILRYMKVHSQDPTWRHFQAISIWSSPYVTSLNYHKGSTVNLKSHEFPCSLLNFQNFYYWKQLNVKLLSARSRNSRPEVFCKKAFLKIAQNSQKSTCARVPFLIKLLASASCIFCEFCETLRTPIFIEHLRWLLLKICYHIKWNDPCKRIFEDLLRSRKSGNYDHPPWITLTNFAKIVNQLK